MEPAPAFREQTHRVSPFQCLPSAYLPSACGGARKYALSHRQTCFRDSRTSVLSTSTSGESLLRLMGSVPAASMSQLEKVRRPNWVALAVRRMKLRDWNKTTVMMDAEEQMKGVTLVGSEPTRRLRNRISCDYVRGDDERTRHR